MNCLLFIKEGFVRKFPLNQEKIFIGRDINNDLVLDNPAVSRRHARLDLYQDYVLVTDLNSSNGVFFQGKQTDKAEIRLNEFFTICGYDFLLQKCDPQEFEISSDLQVELREAEIKKRRITGEETHSSLNLSRLIVEKIRELPLDPILFEKNNEELSLLLQPLFPRQVMLLLQDGELYFNLLDAGNNSVLGHIQDKPSALTTSQSLIKLNGVSYRARVITTREKANFRLILLYPIGIMFDKLPPDSFLMELFLVLGLHRLGRVPPISAEAHILHQGENYSLVGCSQEMKRIADICRRIADKDKFVLIIGESGTGKELIARMIHDLSNRHKYLGINCAAIPATLLESELFGYEAGAFTDARKRKIGKIEEASGGTLVLDEIGDMPLETQAKLLRVIQEKAFSRLGGNETIPVNLRIISLTNQNLYQMMKSGLFRQDLYFRLRVHELVIPPLRERREDIPALINHFTALGVAVNQVFPRGFSREAHDYLQRYDWPGNVRELENAISRLIDIVDDGEIIGKHHLCRMMIENVDEKNTPGSSFPGSRRELALSEERQELLAILEANAGNKTRAARQLGITYQGLLKKLRRLNLADRIGNARKRV